MPDPNQGPEPGFGPESIPIDDAGDGAGQDRGSDEPEGGGGTRNAAGVDAEAAWKALRDGLGAAAEASGHGEGMQCVELCPICRAADILRASGPPELRGQISDFQREALMTLRSLLDHYIERMDEPPSPLSEVEEIPIE